MLRAAARRDVGAARLKALTILLFALAISAQSGCEKESAQAGTRMWDPEQDLPIDWLGEWDHEGPHDWAKISDYLSATIISSGPAGTGAANLRSDWDHVDRHCRWICFAGDDARHSVFTHIEDKDKMCPHPPVTIPETDLWWLRK